MNDDAVRRASELLLKGATMLQDACPDCNNPIYKLNDGAMRCAYCDKGVIRESSLNKAELKELHQDEDPIYQKIMSLKKQLQAEEDPDKIIKLAETIKKLQEIL
ncbi:MAG: Sjogren's syndrome/scleroderma autoantigen 1 family protein [Candidatus Kariarchaeaceae archaeon]|jgi:uncharacterized Zn finger protein (UPF0148 family)